MKEHTAELHEPSGSSIRNREGSVACVFLQELLMGTKLSAAYVSEP